MIAIWTIGHSTRPLDEFLALLARSGIEALADVRRYPGSRRWPQYGEIALATAVQAHGITYVPLPELGGRRPPAADSPNTGWRSGAFRGYADYMRTEPFAEGLNRLVHVACGMRTAMMCAEAVWWRCHRALIADALCVLGVKVFHILGPSAITSHPYTQVARVIDGELVYAP